MEDVGPVHPRAAFKAMIEVLNALLDATADYDPDDDCDESLEESRRLHLQAIEALCLLERDFPLTELSIFVHEILHVPEFIYRWNAVRNYWCFTTERFVGWMKTFVKNRSLSVENMVHLSSRSMHYVQHSLIERKQNNCLHIWCDQYGYKKCTFNLPASEKSEYVYSIILYNSLS